MPAPITANTIPVTQKAAEYFTEAVQNLDSIKASVFEAGTTLANQAMITTAGGKFLVAVTQWTEDFDDIRNTMNWMAEQLATTAKQMLANEAHNVDIATGITSMPLPTYV